MMTEWIVSTLYALDFISYFNFLNICTVLLQFVGLIKVFCNIILKQILLQKEISIISTRDAKESNKKNV